jgi:hypothetical protein
VLDLSVTGPYPEPDESNLHLPLLFSCASDIIRVIKTRGCDRKGHVTLMGKIRNAYKMSVGKPEGKKPIGRPRGRWDDNIRMDLRNK